jgi:hypothetical protein
MRVVRLVDGCHSTLADLFVQAIVVKRFSDESSHTLSLRLAAH